MGKSDPTLNYLKQLRADKFRFDLDTDDTPSNRRRVGRLSWDANTFPSECSDQQFAQTIEKSSLEDSQFYLDTCFVTGREIDPSLWVALLRKSIVITIDTWDELKPWLRNPFVNKEFRDLLLEAIEVGHPAIRFESPPNPNRQLEFAVRYYVQLLAFRKRAFDLARANLRRDLQREPTEAKVETLTQRMVQDRGWQIASKGRTEKGKPNFFTDETVLVRAIVSAISTGRETAVLTRDRDLVEQFYKLLYLIDTHYRGFLIAEEYRRQPLNFIECPWPKGSEYFDTHFRTGTLLQIPNSATDRFLPEHHHFVMVHVYRFSPDTSTNKLVTIGFCAEQEMLPMLKTKGATRGRSTSAFGLKNIHRCIDPHRQEIFGSIVALSVDRGIELDDVLIPTVDIELVIARHERIGRIEVMPQPDLGNHDDESIIAWKWARFRCDRRLAWSPTDEPMKLTSDLLAKTLGFLPFSVRTHLDPSFLTTAIPNDVRNILQKTECGTSAAAFEWATKQDDLPETCLANTFSKGRCPSWLHTDSAETLPEPYLKAYQLYLALLVFRKQFGSIVETQLTKKLGRKPTENEWLGELKLFVGKHVLRGVDAKQHYSDPSYYIEDEFLTLVVIDSILSGSDCVILTRRKVVQQQFISLVLQLEQHYRAWSLAPHDSDPPAKTAGFDTNPDPRFANLGFRDIGIHHVISMEFANSCLPTDAVDVQLQCWLIEGTDDDLTFLPATFLAERPMHAMLKVRGETGGLTTDQLGAEDLHFFWAFDGSQVVGRVRRGESSWTAVGCTDLPKDSRINLGVEKVPTKDLLSMANQCDFPPSFTAYQ